MNAVLKIYRDCTSDEPSKTYTCKRLIFGVAKKLEEISKKSQKAKTDDEANEYTLEFLKTIFKDFDDKDLDGLDPNDFFEFMKEVTGESQKILSQAQKN